VCACVCEMQAKRKYYDKSQQSDTAQMTVKDAQAQKSLYAPKKLDSVRSPLYTKLHSFICIRLLFADVLI